MTAAPQPTIAQTLRQLQAQGLDRLDAQMLLLLVFKQPEHHRAWLLAHDTDRLDAATQQHLDALVARRLRGEPMAYLIGHKAFYGLNLLVDARVLVPRPDTETLVDWALAVLAGTPQASVMDLGTGSGAVALALKATRPDLQVQALDFSTDALAVARTNAQRLGLQVQFSQGSWLSNLAPHPSGLDAIVSNPPYIVTNDPHLDALTHEPQSALTSGADGLDDIRQIISQAVAHLRPGGWLLLEHSYDQAARVRDLLQQAGFSDVQSRPDLSGIERCSGGQAGMLAPKSPNSPAHGPDASHAP
jgi:release factor glutamine methyltransferase